MAEKEKSGNGGSTKTGLTLIVGLFAVITGIYSMMEPMGQRIDFMSTQLEKALAQNVERDKRELKDHAQIKVLKEKLEQLEKDKDITRQARESLDIRIRCVEQQIASMQGKFECGTQAKPGAESGH